MVPNGDMGDGEVTRDGTRLAVTSDYGANKTLAFFAVKGDLKTTIPDVPGLRVQLHARRRALRRPDLGAGRRRDRVGEQRRASRSRASRSSAPATAATLPNDITLSATGSEPDWGPADPPRRRLRRAAATPQPHAADPAPRRRPPPPRRDQARDRQGEGQGRRRSPSRPPARSARRPRARARRSPPRAPPPSRPGR